MYVVSRMQFLNAGYSNCNSITSDGCEVNLKTITNCGGCSIVCAPAHAVPSCSTGSCAVSSCNSGWADCNSSPGDGCETDLTTTINCGACGSICNLPDAVPTCLAGACYISSCINPFADCDSTASNGCEVNLQIDTAHCGTCSTVCTPMHATPSCTNSSCTIAMCNTSGWTDCNLSPTDGCEINVHTILNCGSCGTLCNLAHCTESCATGSCVIATCDMGYADCNLWATDGCETDITTVINCGTCGTVCNLADAVPMCLSGSCDIFSCVNGYDDCDSNPSTGCETNLLISATNCGSCHNNCSLAHSTSACLNGSCVIAYCDLGYINCNGITSDGCEVNILTSATNCGHCGNVCNLTHASAVCSSGACAISSCDTAYGDCDGSAVTGCEKSLRTLTDCGLCGTACHLTNCAYTCSGGACAILTCNAGYANCDGVTSNGCEADLTTVTTCGSCITCNLAYATAGCSNQTCVISSCNSGYSNCDGIDSTGCEVNLYTTSHCGSCNYACPSYAHSSQSCSTGVCVMSCVTGYANCDGSITNGCEADLSSTSTCGSCSTSCATGTSCNCLFTGCSCSGACFHGDELVSMISGEYKKVKDLLSGDRVYSLNEQNQIIEDEIIMMVHKEPNTTVNFCVVETVLNHTVTVTCDHYFPTRGSAERFVTPAKLTPNNFLYVQDTGNKIQLISVKRIRQEAKIGFYTPATYQGIIFVNNIAASCYPEAMPTLKHETIHNILAPFRWWYTILKLCGVQQPFPYQSTPGFRYPFNHVVDNAHLVFYLFQTSVIYQKIIGTVLLVVFATRFIWRRLQNYSKSAG
ncbi:unnamed protein product [Didymodactylos carnosus]|uniref:Hint domain-containing protein n=1 Tax=Didymodactylos carnosus TaxID=1234261 RepID=A0A814XZU4_9BILA|nr:unnamed protein product [Didymodactylos carnosus]CAF3985800.1 unnamed protein product [Didymodactylos carnosus]